MSNLPARLLPPPQALEAILAAAKGSLPLNVKVILEGEEEVRGSEKGAQRSEGGGSSQLRSASGAAAWCVRAP